MNWVIEYLPEARKDMQGLDHSVQTQVLKGIRKVAGNPVSVHEGGYGKPLGNKNGNDLTGLFKIITDNLYHLYLFVIPIPTAHPRGQAPAGVFFCPEIEKMQIQRDKPLKKCKLSTKYH